MPVGAAVPIGAMNNPKLYVVCGDVLTGIGDPLTEINVLDVLAQNIRPWADASAVAHTRTTSVRSLFMRLSR